MEAVGATASIVGIVSFGLSLAKTLQTFIDSVIEAEETITLIVADVNATASTLKRVQDFIDHDKITSEEQHRATVFNNTGIGEISALALQCQKVYVQIIVLIEKASMQVGEDGSFNTTPQAPAADDPNAPALRLTSFSKNVTKLGRRMKWPWLEPRIKRCQEHLGRYKLDLMFKLLVFSIAESRARPSVARVLGTDDETEMRDKAKLLREKMMKYGTKKETTEQPKPQSPRPDDGPRVVTDATRTAANASSAHSDPATASSTASSSSSERIGKPRRSRMPQAMKALRAFKVHVRRITASKAVLKKNSGTTDSSSTDSTSFTSSSTSSLGSGLVHRSWRSRRSRTARAVRGLRAIKVHIQKRAGHRAVFKKDLTSTIFEAYLIYPGPGPTPSIPGIKLPFGHRRLAREIKQTLRKSNPWDILLRLSPEHRDRVDGVVQQVQLAAIGNTNVCLVAIDVDRYGEGFISRNGAMHGYLVWNRMVLFFCHEAVCAPKETAELETGMFGGPARFTASVGNIFSGNKRRSKKLWEFHERLKRELDEKTKEEAENKAERESIEKGRTEIEEARKDLEAEITRIEEERNIVESNSRTLKNAEEAVLKSMEKDTTQGEMKKIFEEEYAKAKASEEKAAAERAERAKLPVKFKDAVGRKYSFPFDLVQTWKGMEDLIRKAFLHVAVIGPHVQEGHYDLLDSQGQMILPVIWDVTIQPGASVSMRMWPPRQPDPRFPERPWARTPPHPHIPRPGVDRYRASAPPFGDAAARNPFQCQIRQYQMRQPAAAAAQRGGHASHHGAARVQPMRPPGFYGGVQVGGAPPLPPPPGLAQPPPGPARMPPKSESEDLEEIDKELGLDELGASEQMASKDIDELLAAWTNLSIPSTSEISSEVVND